MDEKFVAVGIGVGYQEDPRWAKKSTPPVRGGGGGGILKNHLSCTVCFLGDLLYILTPSPTQGHDPGAMVPCSERSCSR